MMKCILILFLSVLACDSFAASPAEDLQSKLNSIRTMTADFKQVVSTSKRQVSNSSGTMALERPGRFRWFTKSPMEQLVVADQKQLWVYDVDLEQVTVKKQEKGLGGTAALFLSGYNDTITQDFTVTENAEGEKQVYDLQAKSPKANFQRLKLTFVDKSLNTLEMFDQLGQHTVVTLKNVKNNETLSLDLFQFKPPKGVDVVQQ